MWLAAIRLHKSHLSTSFAVALYTLHPIADPVKPLLVRHFTADYLVKQTTTHILCVAAVAVGLFAHAAVETTEKPATGDQLIHGNERVAWYRHFSDRSKHVSCAAPYSIVAVLER
jgi:hypothetical protein